MFFYFAVFMLFFFETIYNKMLFYLNLINDFQYSFSVSFQYLIINNIQQVYIISSSFIILR